MVCSCCCESENLQQWLLESGVGWDDLVPQFVWEIWEQWRTELPALTRKFILRCYFPKEAHVTSVQLYCFCDASKFAYAALTYLQMIDQHCALHVSLVMSKTKVAQMKQLTIPRLEMCGATLLAELLHPNSKEYTKFLRQCLRVDRS